MGVCDTLSGSMLLRENAPCYEQGVRCRREDRARCRRAVPGTRFRPLEIAVDRSA